MPNKPEWGPTIDPTMLEVIEQLQAFQQPPLAEMTAVQARMAKTPKGAVEALLISRGEQVPKPKATITHELMHTQDESLLARVYTPTEGTGPFPVIVYFHGGGWVIADLDTYEPSPIALAEQTGAVVVSVGYRQAPEFHFPIAHDDAFAAWNWVVDNTAKISGDPSRIAIAGESAGGNLAVAVALTARDRGTTMPLHILSVYPIADGDVESPSYEKYAKALPLDKAGMEWFFDNYKPDWREKSHPWISLVETRVEGLPPTTIINAEIDPLASEGEELAKVFSDAGIDVVQKTYAGVTHEFFGMAPLIGQAVEAQALAAKRLKEAFDKA